MCEFIEQSGGSIRPALGGGGGGGATLKSQNSLEQQPFHQDSHSVEDTLVLPAHKPTPVCSLYVPA